MKNLFRGNLEESKILFAYRYVSLFITSIFYILSQDEHDMGKKLFIILCLSIASIILSYLYASFENSKNIIKRLLIIETVSNSILLIPSGGIESPFIWYTLNTLLISTMFLERIYLAINTVGYVILTSLIANLNRNYRDSLLNSLRGNTGFALSILIIIISVELLSKYIKESKARQRQLEELNQEIILSNNMLKDLFEQTKALYQSVNIFSIKGNIEGLIKVLFSHMDNIIGTNEYFYYDLHRGRRKIISPIEEKRQEEIKVGLIDKLETIYKSQTPKELDLGGATYIISTVGKTLPYDGLLGIRVGEGDKDIIQDNLSYQIQFFAELISMTLERIKLQELSEKLVVSEEQNRIANEIHDSVLQRLFSMSCGVFIFIKQIENLSKDEMLKRLDSKQRGRLCAKIRACHIVGVIPTEQGLANHS